MAKPFEGFYTGLLRGAGSGKRIVGGSGGVKWAKVLHMLWKTYPLAVDNPRRGVDNLVKVRRARCS